MTRDQFHVCDIAQRNLYGCTAARGVGDAYGDTPDGIGIAAILVGKPNDHGEVPVAAAFVEVPRRLAADGSLHSCVDVSRGQPESRRPRTVNIDPDRRLAQGLQNGQIRYPRHSLQHTAVLLCSALQSGQIVPEQLYRVLSLYARRGLLDVVLDVLREVEFDSG